jgi:hypothetical protein
MNVTVDKASATHRKATNISRILVRKPLGNMNTWKIKTKREHHNFKIDIR